VQAEAFLGLVQHRARLASRAEADRATAATLLSLGERLDPGARRGVASQLDPAVARYLDGPAVGEPQAFSLDEFLHRVADREGVGPAEAAHHARAVLSVLRDAVTPGAFDDVRSQLPRSWGRLLDAGSEGEVDLRLS
jgi:uncharacterized protein (DUF2267 family)